MCLVKFAFAYTYAPLHKFCACFSCEASLSILKNHRLVHSLTHSLIRPLAIINFIATCRLLIKKFHLQNVSRLFQGVQNLFSKQEMELSKQEMELFLQLTGL